MLLSDSTVQKLNVPTATFFFFLSPYSMLLRQSLPNITIPQPCRIGGGGVAARHGCKPQHAASHCHHPKKVLSLQKRKSILVQCLIRFLMVCKRVQVNRKPFLLADNRCLYGFGWMGYVLLSKKGTLFI